MSISSKKMLSRTKELLSHAENVRQRPSLDDAELDFIVFGTISLLKTLYGDTHDFLYQITQERKSFISHRRNEILGIHLTGTVTAILKTLKFEIQNGLIHSLEKKAKGEVLGDFISLSKQLLQEGYKDSAAVLAAAALEDTMKKFAIEHTLEVDDKDLSTVVNALKTKGLIKGVQGSLIQSFIQLRNKALHAQFDKIESTDISTLIHFVENFLLKNF